MEQSKINHISITAFSQIMAKQDVILALLQQLAAGGDAEKLKDLVEESQKSYKDCLQDYAKMLSDHYFESGQ